MTRILDDSKGVVPDTGSSKGMMENASKLAENRSPNPVLPLSEFLDFDDRSRQRFVLQFEELARKNSQSNRKRPESTPERAPPKVRARR